MKLFLTLCGIVIFASLPASDILATATTPRLKILPLDCIFETINDGSNTIVYLTPKTCGQLDPDRTPPPLVDQPPIPIPDQNKNATAPPVSFGAVSGGTFVPVTLPPGFIQPSHRTTTPARSLRFIGTLTTTSSRLTLTTGQSSQFVLSSDGTSEMHSITVKEARSNYVVLIIASKPIQTRLTVGDSKRYDITQDGIVDIQVTLRSVAKGTAVIDLRKLPHSRSNSGATAKTLTNAVPYILIVSFATGWGAVATRKRIKQRRSLR